MEYSTALFDGIHLTVPVIEGVPFYDWAGTTTEDYGCFCGAGEGLGEKIIPESLLFLKISVACHIHDLCWELAEPTQQALDRANKVFLDNLQAINKARSGWVMRIARAQIAMFYYSAVDTKKNKVFWNLKREQESII